METQIATSLKERVCGLACWISQSFEYDLKDEDKLLLKEMSRQTRALGKDLHLLMYDHEIQPQGSLVGRRGFGQIFGALCDYLRTVDRSTLGTTIRTLTDSNRSWTITLLGADIPLSMRTKVNSDNPFVVYVCNRDGNVSCSFVLGFDECIMPKGVYEDDV